MKEAILIMWLLFNVLICLFTVYPKKIFLQMFLLFSPRSLSWSSFFFLFNANWVSLGGGCKNSKTIIKHDHHSTAICWLILTESHVFFILTVIIIDILLFPQYVYNEENNFTISPVEYEDVVCDTVDFGFVSTVFIIIFFINLWR